MTLSGGAERRSPLVRDGSTPMYRQLADAIRHDIFAGTYRAADPLPTERELMARHDVSRVTVRLAMDELANDGLIVRHRGKGTFVAPSRVRHDLSVVNGFFDALSAQGVEPKFTLDTYEEVAAAELGDLALPYDTNVYVERTYIVDEEPIAVVRAALHPRAAQVDRATPASRPNYAILTHYLGFTIGRAEVSIRAELATRSVASALGVSPNDAVLILDRRSYAAGDVLVEHSSFTIRADRYEFAVALRDDRPVAQAIRAHHSPPAPRVKRGAPNQRRGGLRS